ncbi:MAG: hypothetical protein COB73_00905 [Flavobacteriaceae bacterium]|nr:MAG: hypothetical protein COB73_00905 [Flavobacteriaceae bacterium]
MKVIINILKISQSEYMDCSFERYVFWCGIYCHNNADFQKMLISKNLYKWYMRQYLSLESNYINLILDSGIEQFSYDERHKLWHDMVSEIGSYYPKSILKGLRKDSLYKLKSKTIFNLN